MYCNTEYWQLFFRLFFYRVLFVVLVSIGLVVLFLCSVYYINYNNNNSVCISS